ncbi:IpaB/EvcA family protein [Limosilactobacillus caecicola]|uniref:IpaB/EvcA family protein n=1 Tax=Limosilactobacillus caecicola TaxID=2941332 RepID=UPI00203F2B0D|nr:IpaB/EvcA family protein [Limosilactobacillus caecicola]
MMPEKFKLNQAAQSLLDAVNELYPEGNVFVQFDEDKEPVGYVRHDQARQTNLPGGLVITVTDMTAPNYTASHELLHLLMLLRGFPQIFFQLSLGDEQLDEQMMIMSTDLYDVAMHRVVVAEQRKHNLIDDQIEAEYLKGIQATITKETAGGEDDERTLRLLTLLDAIVFYGGHLDKVRDQLEQDYPLAFAAALKMYDQIAERRIDSPFEMRRQIVKLYRLFDEQLLDWGLPALHNNEFTTVSPVLSARQLRLKVRQVFEIFHSDMKDRRGHDDIYIGLRRNDHQNSFTLRGPSGKNRSQKFVEMYDEPVEKLLEDLNVPYIVRK